MSRRAPHARGTGPMDYGAIIEVWKMLRPKSLLGEGALEMYGLVITCAARAYNIGLLIVANHDMSFVLGTRNPTNFRRELRRNVTLWVTGTLLYLGFRYFQAKLGWLWRQQLTAAAHQRYFKDKNYYFIGVRVMIPSRRLACARVANLKRINTRPAARTASSRRWRTRTTASSRTSRS